MSSSRAAAAAIILSISANTFSPNQSTAHAFVHPSPFASKCATRRLSQPPPSPIATHTILYPNNRLGSWNLFQMMTATNEDLKTEISSMRVKEIKRELESYGVSTKSFFEKSEMVDALVTAREEGKTPINVGEVNGDATASTSTPDSGASSSSSTSTSTANRTERIQEEMEKCKKQKVGELKKELESSGISTKSYFEKSEFVRAVAELRVDGPTKSTGAGSTSSSGRVEEEPFDPSYRDVIVTKFQGNKELLGFEGKLIEVRAR